MSVQLEGKFRPFLNTTQLSVFTFLFIEHTKATFTWDRNVALSLCRARFSNLICNVLSSFWISRANENIVDSDMKTGRIEDAFRSFPISNKKCIGQRLLKTNDRYPRVKLVSQNLQTDGNDEFLNLALDLCDESDILTSFLIYLSIIMIVTFFAFKIFQDISFHLFTIVTKHFTRSYKWNQIARLKS